MARFQDPRPAAGLARLRARPPVGGAVTLLLAAVALSGTECGCRRRDCVGGDDGSCLPPSACQALPAPTCGADPAATLRVERVSGPAARSSGPRALAAAGDFLLENDLVRVVLDAPEHPQGLAPTGGSIIDLAPLAAGSGDQVNGFFQAAGVLPRDAVHYETWQVIDQRLTPTAAQAFVAVVFRGHLDGDRRVTVVTRYELRPCEPGVRVRSDLFNGTPDPNTLYLADGLFWGDNGLLPFVPVKGLGFHYPSLDLLHLGDAWREWPFVAGRPQAGPDVSYAIVPCDHDRGAGFNDSTLSAAGVPLRPTLPNDGFSYERFIIAAAGAGLAPAAGPALRARAALHGDGRPVTVTGRVVVGGAPFDGRGGRAASLLFYEPADTPGNPDDEAARTPWNEAVPGPDGRFRVDLPPGRAYRVQPYAFGRPAAPSSAFAVGADDADLGDITLDRSAHLQIVVNDVGGQRAGFAEAVLIPVDAPDVASAPSLYGVFGGCTPMLGPPHGGSPACNRALTAGGTFDLLVPPGRYFVYVTRGPFATIDRAEVDLAGGDQANVTLTSQLLAGLLPADVLTGDFHVHGGASYDSSIPDQDRVVSFLAGGVDVIIATDHDVVTTYQAAVAALGVTGQLFVVPGVETTPNIIWFSVPGESFPKTVGHFNFWPIAWDQRAARNGAPWDELQEPGALMDAVDPLLVGSGVRQLNHPWASAKLGRDQGFLRMIQYDPRTPIAAGASFAADVLLRAPAGHHRNIDWNAQEVMSGASRRDWLRYRTLWFSLLSQGILRAGTANSDTHTLSLERVGYPRNLVFTRAGRHGDLTGFDQEQFDADVRQGHLVGTNGPVIDAYIDAGDGAPIRAGLTSVAPPAGATLVVDVAAAPWIPVTEVRFFVNGALVESVDVSASFAGLDHFGGDVGRAHLTRAIADLVRGARGDAWIVVEAGLHQDLPPDDEDGASDGLPDLPDADLPTRPKSAADPRFDLEAIAPGIWPAAFTNPFLLDLNGDHKWDAPGLP
jgi:hypothetical protein